MTASAAGLGHWYTTRMATSVTRWDDLVQGEELARLATEPAREARLAPLPDDVHASVRAAGGTPAFRIVVVAQKPAPGTRLPAYGVKVGQAFRPTTLDLTVAAR